MNMKRMRVSLIWGTTLARSPLSTVRIAAGACDFLLTAKNNTWVVSRVKACQT